MRNPLSVWRNQTSPISHFLKDDFFDNFFKDMEWPAKMPTDLKVDWNPRAAITEDEKAYHVKVDLPGVTKEHIKVDLNDNYLTVEGERREEKKTDGEKDRYSEVFYGTFQRTFYLPQKVDSERVGAKFENGVLTVELEKLNEGKARSITVK